METSCEFREEWLTRAVPFLEKIIIESGGNALPKVRLTVSWPAAGSKGKAIGECYATHVSQDASTQITINPKMDDSTEVLATLLHELIHASVGIECGHKNPFKKIARSAGLEGKITATFASTGLADRLNVIKESLGNFPHSRMSLLSGQKKQTTRLHKVTCPSCGYTCRITGKWIGLGCPTCPCGEEMATVE